MELPPGGIAEAPPPVPATDNRHWTWRATLKRPADKVLENLRSAAHKDTVTSRFATAVEGEARDLSRFGHGVGKGGLSVPGMHAVLVFRLRLWCS